MIWNREKKFTAKENKLFLDDSKWNLLFVSIAFCLGCFAMELKLHRILKLFMEKLGRMSKILQNFETQEWNQERSLIGTKKLLNKIRCTLIYVLLFYFIFFENLKLWTKVLTVFIFIFYRSYRCNRFVKWKKIHLISREE